MKNGSLPSTRFALGTLATAASIAVLAACGASDGTTTDPAASADAQVATKSASPITPTSLTLAKIGGFTHAGGAGSSEIVDYDPSSRRAFVVNGKLGTVDVLDLTDPTAPAQVGSIDVKRMFGDRYAGANSVAVLRGVVALAIEHVDKTEPGLVGFVRARDLVELGRATVGALPDMLTFTPNGKYLLVANEGEPNGYGPGFRDPEGSVSVLELDGLNPNGRGFAVVSNRTAGFAAFNGSIGALRASGVRIFGPDATVAQDLEPEYIAVSDNGKTAYVTLQENNAVATIDIATATVVSVKALGLKDHSKLGQGMDPSDEDGGVNTNSGSAAVAIRPVPVRGMYQPDGIATYTVSGATYLLTANEGDTRTWPGFDEETRVRTFCNRGLSSAPTAFGDAAGSLILDSGLGRLRVTTTYNGDGDIGKNAAGECTAVHAYGARSFSVWSTDLVQVWDSGDQLERITAQVPGLLFNAGHDNYALDVRSPNKGPEPEGIVVAGFGERAFAFVGLERVGGVMVFDITNPAAPRYETYLNTRTGATGDLGPEGLAIVAADASPNGRPLLLVGHEVSGTTAIYEIRLGR